MSRLVPAGAHRSRRLLPAVPSREGHRATPLELFFDLAYVFAFTQVSRLMAHQHDGAGIVQGLVVLALLWWSWTAFAWLSNHAHADEGVVRVAMTTAMVALFVGGLVLPDAFGAHGGDRFAPVVLVSAYLVARAAHAAVYAFGDVDDPAMRRRVVRAVLLPLVPSAALLVLGASATPGTRLWCWLGAVVLEPALSYLATRGAEFRLPSATHLAERYGLVVILSLGESVLAIGVGVGAAGEAVDGATLLGAVLAMLVSIALWWTYFARYARPAEHALAATRGVERARLANEGYSYLHLVVVAGTVLAALGIEGAMAHVGDAEALGTFSAAALGGGLACFLAGASLFVRRALGAWPVVRAAGALLLLAAVPVLGAVRPLAALGLVVALLVGVLVVEQAGAGRRREAHDEPAVVGVAAG
ncbi:low temperature requirement protein A [Cellulomonas cellasea]|uniref:Low temperature requirement protein LtrA n=1 Tax=Cellulomonas cellasea TaxID=43670 RepID=A0A7W4YBB8_9CELL|nr:low temperature requirement protein A [Cellulomonas cellasea]MBB2923513.1 low temperature requirement protein LtrA [Cellulomonas cellasea]